MPHIERTEQGEQYVLPGTERRTAPGLPYAAEPDGQLALHFYAPPSPDERRRRSAVSRGLKSAVRPAAETAAGLFSGGLVHFPHAFDAA